MDIKQELQSLGFFGIINISFKIIFTWRKIFTQISILFILPLSLIYLADLTFSQLIFRYINEDISTSIINTPAYVMLLRLLRSQRTVIYLLYKVAYLTVLLVFSLLSTSTVVHTIACIYSSKQEQVSFINVMSVVPKVWKRVIVTLITSFVIFVVYVLILGVLMVLCLDFIDNILVFIILYILFFIGYVYIGLIWQMASVISVLESFDGIKAMNKSRVLIKGKMGLAFVFSLMTSLCFLVIQPLFLPFVFYGDTKVLAVRIGVGILCLLLLFMANLLGLVIQTLFYFVCKLFHQYGNIDKSCLADGVEVYLAEHVPLKEQDVQT